MISFSPPLTAAQVDLLLSVWAHPRSPVSRRRIRSVRALADHGLVHYDLGGSVVVTPAGEVVAKRLSHLRPL